VATAIAEGIALATAMFDSSAANAGEPIVKVTSRVWVVIGVAAVAGCAPS
jgi:hypothetical protein